ncbi:MAG: arginine--tRNA ligase [Sedimentisphaerales bacterium]|nr:arginine--tRNA ligase [Sedimentisphaerales bacterium]
MKPIIDILEQRIAPILAQLAPDIPNPSAIVKPSQDPRFGDYQANGIMALAKQLKTNPRELAQQVVDQLNVSDMCEPPEIAGPGFINFRLLPAWLTQKLTQAIQDPDRLGVDTLSDPKKVVVDFAGPNLAKEMHVGHIRSTIIGDVIARILEFGYNEPNNIIRQSHVGDWGLPFGMLVTYLRENTPEAASNPENIKIADLEEFYRAAKQRFDSDETFKQNAYKATVALHEHDQDTLEIWKHIVAESRIHAQAIYDKMNIKLRVEDERGESAFSKDLPDVVKSLADANILQESQGAQCVFLDGFKNKEGNPLPLIVQKSDGAYLYATTDLAAIRFRAKQLKADRIIYVTDARQKLHFQMIFACARQAQWAPENVSLEHVPFGSVLGPDNKPFKTRSGENVKLKDLLDEATQRALKVVEAKNPDLPPEQKQQIAQAVGIGAVKYADLSNNLVGDYVFDWDKMLAMEGNTAPYLQYAYARIQSIFRKGDIDTDQLLANTDVLQLDAPEELTLAKHLLRYGEIIETVVRDLRPHLLTNYLFELAQNFSSFYTNCPVLKADAESTITSRLLLCHQTAHTLAHGLNLLGIKTIKQM